MDRQSLSRRDFAGSVRDKMNTQLAVDSHHPGEEYTPLAFRHYIRRLAILEALAAKPFRTALDVGCAEGYFMRAVHERFGAETWGVDISNAAVEKLHAKLGMPAAAADATRLPFADGSFDVVYSTEVIEHVLDPDLMIAEMRRVSRGLVLVSTPVSQRPDEHEPDYEQAEEGHVNNFDPATVRTLFGPEAQLGSFRCNTSLALIVAAGRYMPAPIRDRFYEFDHYLAKRFGSPSRRFKPLRNRDWLITLPGRGAGEGEPQWRCPACRGSLLEQPGRLTCSNCGAGYPVRDGVPDFFDVASSQQPQPTEQPSPSPEA